MDGRELVQMRDRLRLERADAERQLARLQRHVDALRKASDGMEELLASVSSGTAADDTLSAGIARPSAGVTQEELTDVSASPDIRVRPPSGGPAARMILKSKPNSFLTVREVWDEEAKRGGIAETKEIGRAHV